VTPGLVQSLEGSGPPVRALLAWGPARRHSRTLLHSHPHSYVHSFTPPIDRSQQGTPEVVTTREEAEEMAAAYRKGIKDAEGKLRQHIVAQKEQWTQVSG
jgi:hypothetical protein